MALFHQPFLQLEETEMLSLFRLLRNQRTKSVIAGKGTECQKKHPGVLWEQGAGVWGVGSGDASKRFVQNPL